MLLVLAQQGVTVMDVGSASSAVFTATTAAVGVLLLPQPAQAQQVASDRVIMRMESDFRIPENNGEPQNQGPFYVDILFRDEPTGPITVTATVPDELWFYDYHYIEKKLKRVYNRYTNWSAGVVNLGLAMYAKDNNKIGENDDVTMTFTFSGGGYNETKTVTFTIDDGDGLVISPQSLEVQEGGSASYTVRLRNSPAEVTNVAIGGASGRGVRVSPSRLTFRASNWKRDQTVTIRADENVGASGKKLTLTHDVSVRNVHSGSGGLVGVTVTGTPGVTVTSENPLTMREGESGTYTVKLKTQPAGPVTVTPRSDDINIATVSGALTFNTADWNMAQTVTVTGVERDSATISHAVSGYGSVKTARSVKVQVGLIPLPDLEIPERSLTVREGESGTYTVKLNTKPAGPVTVTPSRNPEVEISPPALTFTTSNWKTAQTVTVSGETDPDANDEIVTVSHTASGAKYNSLRLRYVTVTVEDDDTAGVTVSPTALTVGEGGSNTYMVKLNTQPRGEVTVTPSSDDIGAADPSGALIFTTSNWETAQTVTVSGETDPDANDERVTVSHTASGADYDNVDVKNVTVTVEDDDTAGVTVSPTALTVGEGGSNTYMVKLNTQPRGEVTVTPSSDDTGAADPSGALIFTTSNWETAQTVTVSGETDPDANDERVTVSHTASGADYDNVDVKNVTVTVEDDDTAGVTVSPTALTVGEGGSNTYMVKLNTQPRGEVTVTPSSDDIGAADPSGALIFTTSNWETAQTVTVSGETDPDANDERVTVSHTASGADYDNVDVKNVTVTVEDDDTADVIITSANPLTMRKGESNTYTVKLKTQPVGGEVTVRPRSTNTGAATVSPLELAFTTADWNVAQTVTVSGKQENPSVLVTHTASGADYDDVDVEDVTVTVDSPVIPPPSNLRPEAGNGQVTLTWDALPTGVSVDRWEIGYRKTNTKFPTLWSIHPEQSTLTTTTVKGLDNNLEYLFRIRAIRQGGEGQWSTTVTETPVSTRVTLSSSNPLPVTEGSSESYEVSLNNAQPRGNVIVRIASDDEGAATVSPEVLTFTTSNWETAQMVTVTGKTDDDGNNETVTVNHSVEGYNVVGPAPLTVKVTDDDTPGVKISSPDLTMNQGNRVLTVDEGESKSYTVMLNTQPEREVWVRLKKSGDENAAKISTNLLEFTTSDWNVAQTVTITGEEDDDARNDSLTVIHQVAHYGSVEEADTIIVTVKDNESAPAAPENLAAWSGDKEVILTWNNANDPSITGWQLRYTNINSPANSRPDWEDISVTTAATIKHKVKGLVNGSEYHFYVRAKNDAGEGTAAKQRGTPAAPAVQPPVILPSKMRIVEGTANSPTENVSSENMTYMVVQFLQTPTSDVTVNVRSSYDRLKVPSAESIKTFTVSDWNSNKRSVAIPIYALNDDKEGNIVKDLFVNFSGGGYNQQPIIVPVEIIDNDTSNVVVSRADLSIKEGKSASYEVSLSKKPTAAVMVTITEDPSKNDVTLRSSDLTSSSIMRLLFDTVNWNVRQTVTVTASRDNDGSDNTVTLNHRARGDGYDNTVLGDSVVVTVKEDSSLLSLPSTLSLRTASVAAGVMITPKELTVEEAKGSGYTASYTVALNSTPTGDVTVTATSADPQAAAVSAASRALTFTMMNWNVPQTVTVSGVADVDNAHETVTVSHSVSGANYEDVKADSVTVTVVDAEAAAQDAAQANKARAADLAATSRTLLGMATDVLSARRGDEAMGGGDEAASIGEQASVVMENLLRGGGDLAADIDLDGVEDRLWSQSFQISAPANDDGGLARQGRWSLWGAGALRSYSGEAEENISYSGNLKTAWLGVDYPFTDQWLAGLAVSFSSGESDYSYRRTDDSTDGGKMETRLTTFYPYGSFQWNDRLRLWGMAGFGFGSQKHQPNDEEGETAEGDLRIQMGALGFERQLHSLGALQLSLAGDVGFARSTTTWEADSGLGNLDVSISRARLGVEASFPLGQRTTGRVGVKGRLDGGELEMGAAEVLAGLQYQAGRFSGSLQGKQVYGFDGSYRESGLAAQLRFTARPDGGGLAWELEPSYGTGAGDFALAGGEALWTDEQLEALTGHSSRDGEMEVSSRVGYGIHLQNGALLFTPFTELSLYQGGSPSLGLGLALETPSWDVELSASTKTNGSASPTNKLQLTFSRKL